MKAGYATGKAGFFQLLLQEALCIINKDMGRKTAACKKRGK